MTPCVRRAAVFLALALFTSALPVRAATTQVTILGVSHLVARRDIHNSVFQDSPLSPKRQAQVEDVIKHLARFHPTKVLIEAKYGDPRWAQRYRAYLAGAFTLGAGETHQFGFKLAARAHNSSIYPIDTFGPPLYDDNSASGKRIDAFLSANFTKVKDPVSTRYGHTKTLWNATERIWNCCDTSTPMPLFARTRPGTALWMDGGKAPATPVRHTPHSGIRATRTSSRIFSTRYGPAIASSLLSDRDTSICCASLRASIPI